jgi:hypothetical protein
VGGAAKEGLCRRQLPSDQGGRPHVADEAVIFNRLVARVGSRIPPCVARRMSFSNQLESSSSGNQTLVLFDKDNTKYSRGRIFSITNDELILLDHSSGSTFKIYKRQ